MSFDHIYTITSIDGNMLAVFNPHGKEAKAKTFFDGDLHQLMQELSAIKQQLEGDYKDKSFSHNSKDAMFNLVQKLNASTFKANFKKIITLLESIQSEGLKEKKDAWVFAKKVYEKKFANFIAAVDKLLTSSLGKGFVALDRDSDLNIKVDQNIPINTLRKYFSYISISIIKS